MQKKGIFPTILGQVRSPIIQKPFTPEKGTLYYLYTVARGISDDFGLRKPRHSETIYAKKRYTLLPLYRSARHFRRFWVEKAPSCRNHFRRKKVHLTTSIP